MPAVANRSAAAEFQAGGIKRFRREAEAAASLRSPHTVELYDFGVTDDQTFYLVMELLDGTGCYLLTGHLVFEGATALGTLLQRLHEDPQPLSGRSELPIPPELERLVMSCLARDPQLRPIAAELSRSLAALRVEPWTEADAARWWAANQP